MDRRTKLIFILLAAALATYLIGNERVSLWDRDEPRYAQTSRQMLQSGDWVVPHLYDAVRTAKPVLIYWLQAASMAVFGDTASAARLPSAIAMVMVLSLVALRLRGPRGLWTTLILATSIMIIWAAKSALTDATLLVFMLITQGCLYQIWRGDRRWRVFILMGIAIGLGGLTKGPVILGVPAATSIALIGLQWGLNRTHGRDARVTISLLAKSVLAILIIVAIVGPWMYLVEHRAPGYLYAAFHKEVIDRAKNPAEGHTGPPGYYLLTIWAMYFPWSLFLPMAAVSAWRNRRLPQIRFAMAAIIGPWIMFELIRTKLPHYLLPAYPFMAFLTADALIRAKRGRIKELILPGFQWVGAVWLALVGAAAIGPWMAMKWFPLPTVTILSLTFFSVLALEYARDVYMSVRAKNPLLSATIMGIGMFVLVIVLHVGFLPWADFLQTSRQVADIMKANKATMPGEEIMIDYKEPSLAFYQGGTLREESRNDYLTTTDPIFWPKWIVTTGDVFTKLPKEILAKLRVVKIVRGLDYAGKGVVDVMILKTDPLGLNPVQEIEKLKK